MALMRPLDLTASPLFEPLLSLEFGGTRPEDLADDYTCRAFIDDGQGMAFIFRRPDGSEISLIFHDAVLLQSAGKFAAGATLDSFYRGRYEINKRVVDKQGARRFFYLDFVDDDFSITLAATSVIAELAETSD